MLRAVLDTNVIISSLFYGGKPRRVVDLAAAGRFQALTSVPLLVELELVLAEDFEVPTDKVEEAIREVMSFALLVPETPEFEVEVRDAGDAKVLACAAGGEANYVVTGDADLLSLKEWRGVTILTPDQFLRLEPPARL